VEGLQDGSLLDYEPCHCVNVDEQIYAPVIAGYWRQHELWDGTYTYADWLDIMEIMAVKQENERRANMAAEINGNTGVD
jgi:hypothetical protein